MNPLPITNGPEWARQIRKEAKRIEESEDEIGPNRETIQKMMESWKTNRPAMWNRLRGETLARPLAIVLQDRYWKEADKLMKAGMSWTDAREQAATWLLMGPEDEDQTEE